MRLRKVADRGVSAVFLVNAVLSAVVLLGILAFLLFYGVRTFSGTPLLFTTAPVGARLPVSTARPPSL